MSLRSREAELMDGEALSYAEFRDCLHQLDAINGLSLGHRPTLRWLARLAGERRSLSVLDLGSGGGDMLRRIAAWAARRGIEAHLVGLDLNPMAARAAAEATPPGLPIQWVTADAMTWTPPERPDAVISALFAHHLEDEAIIALLRRMQSMARLGWFVNDLHRHWLPEHFLRLAFRWPGVNRLVRHDGPVSVRRALTRPEWQSLLDRARVEAEITWHFPFRWGVGTHAA
ncbi:methyltransferase domain-containing protein [Sabulicella glaciei]|uniref:Methyltransferase domain-containing protein n=1 Tax=Sabulicella glaciei TaxID=2984948 RepID=A0ABT3P1U5_9PROT|nr:methyltransferase domain-containing protein [Roseococcus sp. MDT2-1-1]